MQILFVVLIIICAVLLMGVVLIQNAKGGGLASNVGISTQMLGGVKKATDGIEKLTWGLMIALFALCIVSGFFFERTFHHPRTKNKELKVNNLDGIIPPAVQNQPDQGLVPTNPNPAPRATRPIIAQISNTIFQRLFRKEKSFLF